MYCGDCVGKYFCYFIVKTFQASIAGKQKSYTQNQKNLITDMEEVM